MAPSTPRPPDSLVRAVLERFGDAGVRARELDRANAREARERSKEWLEGVIERCFDERYEEDERALAALASDGADASGGDASEGDGGVGSTFGTFVRERCARELGTRALVERRIWEILCNAEAARRAKTSESAELFCAFARGSYDDEQLLFFLFARRWLIRECRAMRARGERVTKTDRSRTREAITTATLNVCDVSLDAKQCAAVVRAIFFGGENETHKADTAFLHATVQAMIEDAFKADAESSWATRRKENANPETGTPSAPNGPAPKSTPVVRMDGYRLLKMLLSVFVDTTPPEEVMASLKQKDTKRGETRNLAVAMDASTAEAPTPSAKSNSEAIAAEKGVESEIARYDIVVRAALREAVSKYVSALFPQKVDKCVVDEAETKINLLAQDVLSRVISNAADPSSSTEIAKEAPAACKSYSRAKESIVAGAGTPGAQSPAADGGSSARDIARAILASEKIKSSIEPMLRSSVSSLKTQL